MFNFQPGDIHKPFNSHRTKIPQMADVQEFCERDRGVLKAKVGTWDINNNQGVSRMDNR